MQYHLIGAVSCTRAIAQHAESLRVTTELGLAWVEPSHPSILLSLYIELCSLANATILYIDLKGLEECQPNYGAGNDNHASKMPTRNAF